MEWLNYHHLQYFWVVASEGGIAAASRKLHIGRPAISMQLKSLEAFLGAALFERRGRHLALTETGRLVHDYAQDIFRTGRELMDVVRGGAVGRRATLRVGVADAMAKLVTFQLLSPALTGDGGMVLDCREDLPDKLFAALALHELDLVLSDVPLGPSVDVKAYNHVLGASSTSLFAAPALARRVRRGFPASLTGQPFLMPAPGTAVRRPLEQWLAENAVFPRVVAQIGDSALLKVFGQAGCGVFPAPTQVADRVCKQFGVRVIAELPEVEERYYAISLERRIKQPAVAEIVRHAKDVLIAPPPSAGERKAPARPGRSPRSAG